MVPLFTPFRLCDDTMGRGYLRARFSPFLLGVILEHQNSHGENDNIIQHTKLDFAMCRYQHSCQAGGSWGYKIHGGLVIHVICFHVISGFGMSVVRGAREKGEGSCGKS